MHVEPVKPRTFSVRHSTWEKEKAALRHIRTTVFVIEQRVPEDEEWDGMDAECLHALALDEDGIPIGTEVGWHRTVR